MTSRLVALCFCALLSPATASLAAKWEAIEKLPGRSPIALLVEDKERIYFRLTSQEPLRVKMQGPAQLRVVSRAELGADPNAVISYRLRAFEASTLLDEQSTETSGSSLVRQESENRAMGKSRRMVVDVPAGKHELTLVLEGTQSVLVRLQRGAAAKGQEMMVSLTPVEAPRSVLLAEGERTIAYYSVLPKKAVRLRVVGPTRLELMTRLDFDPTMRGTQTYSLAISDGDRRLREVTFKTTKATTASYTNLTDRVPSKFDRVQLVIEAGTHEISVELLQPVQGSVEIRALIPQPAVLDQE